MAFGNSFGGGASGGGSGGDASTNTSVSVDSEVVLFSGTGGKTLKRATGTGTPYLTSGVLSINKVTFTQPATGSTLTIAEGKTVTINNTLTFSGTDSSSVAFGAGGTVLYNGGALGTPSSGTLSGCTGLPISTGVSGLGTNIATALAVNVGTAGSVVVNGGVLGTPSSGDLSNCTNAVPANASITPAKLSQPFTAGTAVNTTSVTAIDFTSIPSWVKRITVMFNGVSTNGNNAILIQIGASSIATTGYNAAGGAFNYASATGGITSSSGFCIFNSPSYTICGHMIITLLSGSTWISSHAIFSGSSGSGGGAVTLSGTLDRVRLTTVGGTDTFDAGSVNIFYE